MSRPRFGSLLSLFLALPLALAAQFPIPPSGPGAAVGSVSAFELLPFGSAPRVLWSRPEASWLVPLTGELEAGDPRRVDSAIEPAAAEKIGQVVAVVGECRSAAGIISVCIDRYAEDGSLLESQLVEEGGRSPKLASLGDEGLIAFVAGPGRDLVIVRLDRDGRPGARARVGEIVGGPALAAANGSFYLGWSDGIFQVAEIRGGMFVSLVPLNDIAAVSGERVESLELAASDDGVLAIALVHRAALNDSRWMIRVRMLDEAGPWREIRESQSLLKPKGAAIPGGFLVVWIANHGLEARTVGHSGTAGPVRGIMDGEGTPRDLRLTRYGDHVVALFDAGARPGAVAESRPPRDVRMQIFDGAGEPLGRSTIVSLVPAPQLFPRGVFSGTAFTAVWNERGSSGAWRVRGARLDRSGRTIRPLEIPFDRSDQFRPSIAFNGESHLVVWTEGPAGQGAVRGVRLSSDGELLDPEPLTLLHAGGLTSGLYSPRTATVAWSGTAWIVVSTSIENAIVARRFSAAGTPLDEPVQLTAAGERRDPQISCADDDCLLVWRETGHQTLPIPAPDRVHAALIGRDLRNLRPVQAEGAPRAGQLSPEHAVWDVGGIDVSWNASREAWMVVWAEGPGGRVVELDGTVSGAFSPGGFGGSPASVIAGDSGWRVAAIGGFQPSPFPAFRSFGSLVEAQSDRSFAGTEDVEVRSVLQTGVVRSPHLSLDLVAAPRALILKSAFDVETGQPLLWGYFVDPPARRRAVSRP